MNVVDHEVILSTTETGRRIQGSFDKTILEHLTGEVGRIEPADTDNPYFRIVREEISESVERDGGTFPHESFDTLPVIQMADGCMPMTDPEIFYNNALAGIAVSVTTPELFVQQCSTISSVTNAATNTGPAYIHWEGGDFRLFDKSRTTLKHSTPETLTDVAVVCEPVTPGDHLSLEALQPFIGTTYDTAATAIRAINYGLWPFKSRPHLFGEDVSAKVVARALEETDLGDELVDPNNFDRLLDLKHSAVQDPANFVYRDSTDFFYARRGNKLVPLRAKGKTLFLPNTNEPSGFQLNKPSLTEGLRSGKLYPDLALTYATMCLRSGIGAMGGASQQEYLPRIASIFTNEEHGRNLSLLVGSLVEPTANTAKDHHDVLAGSRDVDKVVSRIAGSKLRETIGGLSHLEYYLGLLSRRTTT
jgi:hypothetical protein